MFLITNRVVYPRRSGSRMLGDTPNPHGPQELLAVKVTGSGSSAQLTAVPDSIKRADWPAWGLSAKIVSEWGFDSAATAVPGSACVVQALFERLSKLPAKKRNLLLYVHGYNTPVESVIQTTLDLEKTYGVICLPFTWPSNGGGRYIWDDARGAASYLSDKQDARASVNALDRFILRIYDYIEKRFGTKREDVLKMSVAKFPDDLEARLKFQAAELEKICSVQVHLLLHSMGNYLFEYVMASESNQSSRRLLFENVIMASADVNNEGHAAWVDRIPFRRNLYVTINEDDFALNLSRAKFGNEQKPRLGHFRHGLNATNVKYIDFTGAPKVAKAHTYFLEAPIGNPRVKAFFQAAFMGLRAEEEVAMRYDSAENIYQFP